MSRLDILLAELEHEAETARKHLERLPNDKFDWRPHPKSFTAGELASHIVECIRWVESTFTADELDFDPASYRPFSAASTAELIGAIDAEMDKARLALASAGDTDATQPWRLNINGKLWFEKPREAVFRDMTLNHMVHHRGQLSVYLRLLDVPVPGSYGPSADDGG